MTLNCWCGPGFFTIILSKAGYRVTAIDGAIGMLEKARHRLGNLIRPDWDVCILQAVGFTDITFKRVITGPLWDDKEKLIYGHTPMFMIYARKGE